MITLIFLKSSSYIKSEVTIALLVTSIFLCIPIVGVFAVTKVKTPRQAAGIYNASSYPGDYYAWGNCTWWVSIRRSQNNDPIPNNWGNAATWATNALRAGYIVDNTPSDGAIMQISNVDGGLGHVAYVESVDPEGNWEISEMNVIGLDVLDYKNMSPSMAKNYNFIHDK